MSGWGGVGGMIEFFSLPLDPCLRRFAGGVDSAGKDSASVGEVQWSLPWHHCEITSAGTLLASRRTSGSGEVTAPVLRAPGLSSGHDTKIFSPRNLLVTACLD
jgi:hypothetical protein